MRSGLDIRVGQGCLLVAVVGWHVPSVFPSRPFDCPVSPRPSGMARHLALVVWALARLTNLQVLSLPALGLVFAYSDFMDRLARLPVISVGIGVESTLLADGVR